MADIKAIIFDFDGTLVDSMNVWDKYINPEFFKLKGLSDYECKSFTKEFSCVGFKNMVEKFIEKYNINEAFEQICNEWRDVAVKSYLKYVEFKPGALDFIKYATESGYLLAIASGAFRETIDLYINKNDLESKIRVIVTPQDVKKGKPFPDIFFKAAEQLGVKPEEGLVFEDHINGILAGKAAGMKTFAIYDDYSDNNFEEIKKMADDYFISFEQVLIKFQQQIAI